MTAVWFGLSILPIAVLVFGGIDFARASSEKKLLQDAVDSATLFAARSGQLTDDQLDAVGDAAFQSQLEGSGSGANTVISTFSNREDDSVLGVVTAQIDTLGLGLLQLDYLTLSLTDSAHVTAAKS